MSSHEVLPFEVSTCEASACEALVAPEVIAPKLSIYSKISIISELSRLLALAEADHNKAKDSVFKTEYALVCAQRDVKIAEIKNDQAQTILSSKEHQVLFLKKELDIVLQNEENKFVSEVCFLRNKIDIKISEITELHKKATKLYHQYCDKTKSRYEQNHISDELFITMRNLCSKSRCDINNNDLEEFKPDKSLAILVLQDLLVETELKLTGQQKNIINELSLSTDNDSDDSF
jgi:hypothetical protein